MVTRLTTFVLGITEASVSRVHDSGPERDRALVAELVPRAADLDAAHAARYRKRPKPRWAPHAQGAYRSKLTVFASSAVSRSGSRRST
jgi:hypothetical protein